MPKISWSKVLPIPGLLLGLLCTSAVSAQNIGLVKVMQGQASVQREGKTEALEIGKPVRSNDVLQTGANGSLGVTFIDNSVLSLGPNSVLSLQRFSMGDTPQQAAFDTNLKKGTLSVISGKIAKQSPDAMTVRTPAAILGVRGTEFLVRAEGADE